METERQVEHRVQVGEGFVGRHPRDARDVLEREEGDYKPDELVLPKRWQDEA